jgi:hypothetical protein
MNASAFPSTQSVTNAAPASKMRRVGGVVWGGLYLRDARVRALAPWRK